MEERLEWMASPHHQGYVVQQESRLAYEVEYALVRILLQEVALANTLENIRRDIYSLIQIEYGRGGRGNHDEQFFYGPLYQAFKTINSRSESSLCIDKEMIKAFLQRSGKPLPILNGQLASIMNRLDKDNDGRLAFEEFQSGLLPFGIFNQ